MKTLWVSVIMIFFAFSANAVEVHIWKGEPIKIVLETGKQRIIELPDHANLSVPSSIKSKVLVEPANGSIYITALEKFDTTPARITLKNSNIQIRLNLMVVDATDLEVEHIKIDLFETSVQNPTVSRNAQSNNVPPFMQSSSITDVALMRFGHQLYWLPERLRPELPRGVTPVRIPANLDLTSLMTHCSFGVFAFKALDGFKTRDGRYITTLEMTNLTDRKRYINLTHWNTQALRVSPHDLYVQPEGTAGSYTTLVVITETQFHAAINSNPYIFTEFGMDEGCY
ncbi:hypothetical protein A1QO_00605 [Vibrio genomosp. F10 str. ZF-129]|uniref:Integrating conjugative element protein n=1 Tax=Vibrio genomosp. F10 str. ZF-129 TaxID=1187848 RepID=A0A1E5BG95_9VIBR|nr:DUF3438 family protein [Vibrio genomosp. F10]OEE35292.1 hypothetical protein A1QO_00605 [Vibrio genomosp. F10 str. ZF-129]